MTRLLEMCGGWMCAGGWVSTRGDNAKFKWNEADIMHATVNLEDL